MRSLARPGRALAALSCLCLILVLAPACAPDRADLGRVLPTDTLLWLTCRNLETLETDLEQLGVMPLIVAELEDPEVRRQLTGDWGLALTDDPRADIHAVFSRLARLDVTLHPAPADTTALLAMPALAVWLQAADEEAAQQLAAYLGDRASGHEVWGETDVHAMPAGGQSLWALRVGERLVACSDRGTLRLLHGRLTGDMAADPAAGLAGTPAYERVRGEPSRDVEVYLSEEVTARGFWPLPGLPAPAGPDPARIMARYGSQTLWLGMDYLVTEFISRTAVAPDSRLATLMDGPAVTADLVSRLPADTHAAQVMALHEPAAKLALIREIYTEMAAESPAVQQGLPLATDPFAGAAAVLGFTLEDLASELTELAIAGAGEPRVVVLMRAQDEAAAARVQAMLGGSPALGFLAEEEPHTATDVSLRVFRAAMSEAGELFALGRRGDTVMLLMLAEDVSEFDTYLASLAAGATLADAAPPMAGPHLAAPGQSWLYLDLARLASAWELPLEEGLARLPQPLGERLRGLVVAGHTVMIEPGLTETVMSISGP